MGPVIGEVLPFAIALAASPMHVVVIVLILVSEGARAKGLVFVSGRLLGLALIVGAVVVVVGAGHDDHRATPSTAASIVRIVVGVLLVALAARLWLSRPGPGAKPRPNALLRRLENLTPIRAFVLGLLVTVVDPASLSLGFVVGLDIGQAGLSSAQTVTVAAAFILVATMTTTVPMLIYLIGGVAAERRLTATKSWLMANDKTVMMVLFLILGALLIGRGIRDLTL